MMIGRMVTGSRFDQVAWVAQRIKSPLGNSIYLVKLYRVMPRRAEPLVLLSRY